MSGFRGFLLYLFFLPATSLVEGEDFDRALSASREWLKGSPAEREGLEAELACFSGSIEAVVEALRPKGDSGHLDKVGREIEGDTFSVPHLLDRNEDHPFNFYVPSHYNPETPMGLILFLHGGGTYKAGANVRRRSVSSKIRELENGNFILVAAEACHGVNFPPGAVPDKLANRWTVPASERYLSDLVNEFKHRYHIDPNRIVLWGYSMGGIGAWNHAMRSDRFSAVGIGGASWTWGTFETLINTPVYIYHGKRDSYWNSPEDCRNRMTDVCHARFASEILTELGYEHRYVETDGGHNDVNRMDGKWFGATDEFFLGREGFIVDRVRDPFARRVIAMTPRGIYEEFDPKTSGDPYRQPESPHDRWLSIDEYTPGPIEVDHLIKKGTIRKAPTLEAWRDYSAERGKDTYRGARIAASYSGKNHFVVETTHVRSYSLWLHPEMVDVDKPIVVQTNGRKTTHVCRPSLLTALKSFERREDWGLIYPARITIEVE